MNRLHALLNSLRKKFSGASALRHLENVAILASPGPPHPSLSPLLNGLGLTANHTFRFWKHLNLIYILRNLNFHRVEVST